jgi:hypothetical protein
MNVPNKQEFFQDSKIFVGKAKSLPYNKHLNIA